MSNGIEKLLSVSGKHNDKIQRFTSDLFRHFNFNSFWYNKIKNDGSFVTLVNHMPWTEEFWFKEMYINDPFFRHPKLVDAGVMLLKDPAHERLAKTLSACRSKYDMQILFSLINKTKDGVEEFGFASTSASDHQIFMLFNELPLLRLFARKFKEENSSLLLKLEDRQISLSDMVGTAFYEPSFPITLETKAKQALLKKMGVSPRVSLNQDETDTLHVLLKGYSASEIAQRLHRSKRTIEHRIERIKEKLSCDSKAELIQKATELHMLGAFSESMYS